MMELVDGIVGRISLANQIQSSKDAKRLACYLLIYSRVEYFN